MSLLKLPHAIEARLPKTGEEFPWARSVAALSLVTSAALLLTGKRRAGIAIAVAGTAVALIDEPELVKKWWNSIPDYTKSAHELLQRVEDYVDEIADQGERLRKIVRKA